MAHAGLQHALTYDGLGPDRRQDRLFGDHLIDMGHQIGQDGKGFRRQRDELVVTPETTRRGIEPE
jgi:hypothetical protein